MKNQDPSLFLDVFKSLFGDGWLVYSLALTVSVMFAVIGIKLIKGRNKPN